MKATPSQPTSTIPDELKEIATAMNRKLDAEMGFLRDDPTEMEQCVALALSAFSEREPIIGALITGAPNASAAEQVIAFSGLTALVKVRGEVKAVCVVVPYESDHGEPLPGLEAVYEVLDRLSASYDAHCAASGGTIRGDKTIDLFLGATAADFQNRNAAEMAMVLATMNARARGFEHAVSMATSNSGRVLANNGMKALDEVDYKTFTFQGRKPFASVRNFNSAKLMYRSLADFDAPPSLKYRPSAKL
ncbi:hypothetical protein FB45DRAFT_934894 [Roridomyces roridus]|uniref:Uncharacterized protein n=1 Tax=Roridomyces roridus TaxID=1738132 RepID=A0AAD7BBN8_9AGAR|nr:hypothetical protein FB45DRAFT_934894 [Roridomyces roridus]